MRLLMVILAFNVIIMIHELGHFMVAKLSDIKVEEFSLFVGPKIFSFKKGETTYSLRTIPLLAYVKMEGEDEESDSERAFHKKSVPVRAAVIAAGPFANIISAFIIIMLLYSVAGYGTTFVGEVEEDSPAYEAGIREGDKIVGYNNRRVFQQIEFINFLYASQGEPTEVEVIRETVRDGEIEEERKNIPITPRIIPAEQFLIGFEGLDDENSNVVGTLTEDKPGIEAGLLEGDRIIKINDTEVSNLDEIRSFMSQNGENPIILTVEREGESETVEIGLIPEKVIDNEHYYVGMAFEKEEDGNFFDVVKHSAIFTFSNARMVPISLGWLVTGQISFGNMAGPVGIGSVMNEAVQDVSINDAILRLLELTALISVAIGATNLIPFPALDGSKLVMLGIEAIRRKPVPIEKEAIVMTVGFFLLIGLAIIITTNDIINIVN
ncbi:RIP metalloprotease RseP [Herbivorax sp. ANBcel31]|uniref:RIP metalloprotease RseP n=1 Tax=Herbivorax sp. ANBcel31 TaxID=3069754 RepID=UPI0027B7EA6C|nr:RIP metalloprotease RseP [Herbivorax sp. ANBcel31]MDQ2086904.1 RIP metalloprotease RseP [Herbivorax sp. ANBcel31]